MSIYSNFNTDRDLLLDTDVSINLLDASINELIQQINDNSFNNTGSSPYAIHEFDSALDISNEIIINNNFFTDLNADYINNLDNSHNDILDKFDVYKNKQELLKKKLETYNLLLNRLQESKSNNYYYLFLCWLFIFIIVGTSFFFSVVEEKDDLNLFSKIILVFFILFIVYYIYNNFYLYYKGYTL